MKNLIKYVATILLVIFTSLSIQGCYVHRHGVGNASSSRDFNGKKVASAKAVYLFWGLITLNNPSVSEMAGNAKNYQIKTSYNYIDCLISSLTGGLFSTRTVKVFVSKEDLKRVD